MADDTIDFDALADSITDAPIQDPITPMTETIEEKLTSDPEFQEKRRTIGRFLMDNPPSGKPKTPKEPKPPKEKKALPPRRRGSLVKPLEQLYGAIALALMPFDQVCATAVAQAAPKCAETLDNLAYENEAVRRILLSLVQTSAMGQVLLAHAPILMAIMMHHVPAARNSFGALLGAQTADEAENYLRKGNGETA